MLIGRKEGMEGGRQEEEEVLLPWQWHVKCIRIAGRLFHSSKTPPHGEHSGEPVHTPFLLFFQPPWYIPTHPEKVCSVVLLSSSRGDELFQILSRECKSSTPCKAEFLGRQRRPIT